MKRIREIATYPGETVQQANGLPVIVNKNGIFI